MVRFQASISKGWLHAEGGFSFGESYYLDPLSRRQQDREIHQWIKNRFPYIPIYNMEDNLVQAEFVGENQVLVGGIQPNLILGVLLGSEIMYFNDRDADLAGVPLKSSDGIAALPSPQGILSHPLIRQFDDQITEFKERPAAFTVIPPFFWDTSGRATVHGIITTSLKFLGDQVMMLALTDPDQLHRLHQWITDSYVVLIDHFASLCDFPITSIHVGECSGGMLSNELYEEFVIPYLSQLGRRYQSVRLHSCGNSDHILTAISQIDRLSVIDTGSRTSVRAIRKIMGRTFEVNIAPPVELLLKGSPENRLMDWLRDVLFENGDGPLKIVFHLDVGYDKDNCLAIYYELLKANLIEGGRVY